MHLNEIEIRDIIRRRLIIDGYLRYSTAQRHVIVESSIFQSASDAGEMLQMLERLKNLNSAKEQAEGQIASVETWDVIWKWAPYVATLAGSAGVLAKFGTGPFRALWTLIRGLGPWGWGIGAGVLLAAAGYYYYSIDSGTNKKIGNIKSNIATAGNYEKFFVPKVGGGTGEGGANLLAEFQNIVKDAILTKKIKASTASNVPTKESGQESMTADQNSLAALPDFDAAVEQNLINMETGEIAESVLTPLRNVADQMQADGEGIVKAREEEEASKSKEAEDFLGISYDNLRIGMTDDEVEIAGAVIAKLLSNVGEGSNTPSIQNVFKEIAKYPSGDWWRIDDAAAQHFMDRMGAETYTTLSAAEEQNTSKPEGGNAILFGMSAFGTRQVSGIAGRSGIQEIKDSMDKSFIYSFITGFDVVGSNFTKAEVETISQNVLSKSLYNVVLINETTAQEFANNWSKLSNNIVSGGNDSNNILSKATNNISAPVGSSNNPLTGVVVGPDFFDGLTYVLKEMSSDEKPEEKINKMKDRMMGKIAGISAGDLDWSKIIKGVAGAAGGGFLGSAIGGTIGMGAGILIGGLLGYFLEDIIGLIKGLKNAGAESEPPSGEGSRTSGIRKRGAGRAGGGRRYREPVAIMQDTINKLIQQGELNIRETKVDGIWGSDTDRVWRAVLTSEFSELFGNDDAINSVKDWPAMSEKLNDSTGKRYPNYTPDARGALNIIMDIAKKKGILVSSGGGGRGGEGQFNLGAGTGGNTPQLSQTDRGRGTSDAFGRGFDISISVDSGNLGGKTLEAIGFPDGTSEDVSEAVARTIKSDNFTGGIVQLEVQYAKTDDMGRNKGEIIRVKKDRSQSRVDLVNFRGIKNSVKKKLTSKDSAFGSRLKVSSDKDDTTTRKSRFGGHVGTFTLIINIERKRRR